MRDKTQRMLTVLNTPCVLTTPAKLADDLALHCRTFGGRQPLSVDFTNVHIVAMRTMDSEFYDATSSVDWFVPDSQVLGWGVALLGGKDHARVYGPDFLSYFFHHGDRDMRHFFLGGSSGCLEKLCDNLRAIQPGFHLAGTRDGYFSPADEESIIAHINEVKPDLLWVGLGTPKQQQWIHRNKHLLHAGALLAVGFAFDVNAGTKKDAPHWLGPLGLTWVHRLLTEPRRLWKRYLIYNSVYLCRLFNQAVFHRQYSRPR